MAIWERERKGAARIRRKREVSEARNHSYRTVGKYSCTVLYCTVPFVSKRRSFVS